MIFLWCSHQTRLRFGGKLHITDIHALLRGLSSISLLFFATYTLCTPPSKYPPQGILLHEATCMHAFVLFCFTSPLLVLLFALGRVEGQGRNPWPGCSRSQDPPLPYICKDINTPTYVHMRAPTQVLAVVMQVS